MHINPARPVVKVRLHAAELGMWLNVDLSWDRFDELRLKPGEIVYVAQTGRRPPARGMRGQSRRIGRARRPSAHLDRGLFRKELGQVPRERMLRILEGLALLLGEPSE